MTEDSAPTATQRSRWKLWLPIGVGVVLILGVGTSWRVEALAEHGLRAMAEDVEGLLTATRSEDGRRPVLVGPAMPGSAWQEYQAALGLVAAKATTPEDYLADLHQRDVAMVKAHRAALDHLALGAAHEHGQFPYQWDQGALMDCPDVIHGLELVRLARAQARLARESGATGEALSWLLRGCQLGRDIGHNGTLVADAVGAMGVGECLEDLASIVDSGALSDEALTRLAEQLALLDAQLPTWSRGRRNETLFWGITLHNACTSGTIDDELPFGMKLAGWRYLFSTPFMVARAWPPARDMARIVEAADDHSWSETRALLQAKVDEMTRSDNPVVGLLTRRGIETSETLRRALAMARLLRAAVVFRTTGERLDLRDPFGERLRWSPDGEPEKIWSIGPDAIDDGGRGGFSLANRDPDLVLSVRR